MSPRISRSHLGFLVVLIIALIIGTGVFAQGFRSVRVIAFGVENARLPIVFGSDQKISDSNSTPTSTVTATSTSTPTAPPTVPAIPESGKAVVAFNDDESCDNFGAGGIKIINTDEVRIDGGDVFSNSCLLFTSHCYFNVTGGDFSYAGGIVGSCPHIFPPPQSVNFILSIENFSIPGPDCSVLPMMGAHTGGGGIIPGIYQSIQVPPGDNLVLESGLYCLQGDFRHFGNILYGDSVTIYMQSGDFIISNGDIYLTAPTSVNMPSEGVLDVLLFVDQSNIAEVNLSGIFQWQMEGVIYGPSSTMYLSGSSLVDLIV